MAPVAPPQVIDAPQRTPVSYGLFSVASPVQSPGFRWVNGVVWKDQPCEVLPPVIEPDCPTPTGLPKDFSSVLADGVAVPFTVYGETLCSPVSFSPAEAQQRAAARLFTREEQRVTAYLIQQLIESGGPLEGLELTTPTTAVDALSALESHLAVNYASRGLLVMNPDTLYALGGADAIVRTSSGLFTLAGTPIVVFRADTVAGFDMGIVPMPVLYRSEVFTSSDRPGDLLDRATNDMYAVAERTYVLGWLPCGGAFVDLSA